jgi:hypothetical protein
MGTVAAPDLPAALTAARSIPDVRGCAEATSVIAPPPANVAARVTAIVPQIERALVLATAQRPEALATAQALTREARETRYDPVIARALLVEGRAASGTDAAKETFAEALAIALRAIEDRLAVEAYARWIFERTLDFDRWEITADNWLTMDAISERLGREGRVARALMYNNRGLALRLLADRDGARRSFERARQIAGDSTELELVHIESNLAQLDRDPVQIERRFIEVRERLEASLGPRHPDVLLQRLVIALVTRHRDRARAELDDVCRDLERWGFTNEWRECAFDRALFAEEEGASAHALELLKRIPPGDGDLKVTIASAYIAVATGARDRHERVEKLRALPEPDPTWWARGAYAAALAVIAKVDAAAWERVVAMLVLADQPVYVRRLAHARWRLAEHWRASRPEAAREQAELALAWYRGAIGYEDVVARLEEITGPSSP